MTEHTQGTSRREHMTLPGHSHPQAHAQLTSKRQQNFNRVSSRELPGTLSAVFHHSSCRFKSLITRLRRLQSAYPGVASWRIKTPPGKHPPGDARDHVTAAKSRDRRGGRIPFVERRCSDRTQFATRCEVDTRGRRMGRQRKGAGASS